MWSPETIGIWIGAVAQTVIVLSLFILREQIKSSKRIHESETAYDTFRFLGEIRDEIEHIDALGTKISPIGTMMIDGPRSSFAIDLIWLALWSMRKLSLSLQLQSVIFSVIFIQLQKHTRFYSDCSPLTEGQDLGVVGSQTGPRAPDAQLNPYPAAVK
jgi:hypothetical protein